MKSSDYLANFHFHPDFLLLLCSPIVLEWIAPISYMYIRPHFRVILLKW